MDKKITNIYVVDDKEFYLALNYSFSFKKQKVLIVDCSNINYLSNIWISKNENKLIESEEFFKIKPKKLSINLDYLKIEIKLLSIHFINFFLKKYDHLVFIFNYNQTSAVENFDTFNILFTNDNIELENKLITIIKSKKQVIILPTSFNSSVNSEIKANINLFRFFENYIYKNIVPFPLVNFYEKPYIISESFFDKNLISFFKELKK